MKNKKRSYLIILASTAFLLFLILFSSTVLAVNNGEALAFQGNYEDTIKAYDKTIENNSQDSDAWYDKGVALAFQGNFEEAIKAFDKVTEIDPQLASAWYNKGVCLASLGNYEEAIKAYDKAIEINSQYSKAWVNKGACLASLGNYEEAIKAIDKAIEIDPRDPDTWYNKGSTLAFSQGNYEEAIKAYDKAIEINSGYSYTWYNKGLCLVYLGNYKDAIKAFDKAIEIDPRDPDSWYNKGLCLAHLGKYKEAEEALDKAIEINPQHHYALSLKESILLNSNGLPMSLKSLFSNSNIFVEDDDLLEYAQTYLKTYEDIINESNLTSDDLGLFSFYQSYPYSANATISNTSGASITFIPDSIDKNKVTRIPYPIEKLIPIISNEELNSPSIRGVSINGNSSDICMVQNIYGGNVSSISDMKNYSFRDGFVHTNNFNNQLTNNAPIILGEGTCFNGLTYIDSNKVFRKGELIINGTVVLNDSKVIMKSNLKKDWTKENAEEDAIATIYKELIDKIFDYSKLTGIGYREIEPLVTEYKEKENSGYYKTNKYAEWSDRQKIFDKAKQYGIPYESVLVELLNNKQEETLPEIAFRYVGDILTVKELAVLFIGIIGWIKRKDIRQKLKKVLRVFFRD
ncbi:MAG TPA: tetratricopeptide repeat protein [Methanosarcina thermophila]|nr:tetratricopeptide repeat protein [Methanosarcina thermophila]HPZ20387.1 tetratricopeptide repeat protein [Methanosarcina thermophila]HQD94777.1 tetratricopeptide repeat protein [Methanosarcina thermophila]